ncbi:Low choriolytic enzyme [Merluccius polli]|uniref:Metalloendopeptidase n=1 Tax=Merluccius polli TaxID=89951 RepID=A0AA47MKU9_MERPO|nr:Low choriolytic enzyme [Merluccius polli]
MWEEGWRSWHWAGRVHLGSAPLDFVFSGPTTEADPPAHLHVPLCLGAVCQTVARLSAVKAELSGNTRGASGLHFFSEALLPVLLSPGQRLAALLQTLSDIMEKKYWADNMWPYFSGHFGDLIADAINYSKNNPETLEEMIHSDEAIVEGDMIMSSDRNALEDVWSEVDGNISVPYEISLGVADRTLAIQKAMELISEHTCVSFHKRTTELDYLFFHPSRSCASFVGFHGGEQRLYVGPFCSVGNIVHELLHALGFHHEHTRDDRDQYISIAKNNIMEGLAHNFLIRKGKTFGLPYDTSSIMHYGRFFFSKNGLPTVIAKKKGAQMGQRSYLTPLDIKRVRVLYKCDERAKKEKVTPVLTPAGMEFLAKFNRLKELILHGPFGALANQTFHLLISSKSPGQ